jgi:hypothetical protein
MHVTKNLIIILLLAISFSLQNCIAQQNNWLHFTPENAHWFRRGFGTGVVHVELE